MKQPNRSRKRVVKTQKNKKPRRQRRKNISLKDAITKVVEAVKHPFSKKSKTLSSKDKLDNAKDLNANRNKHKHDVPFAESSTISNDSKFFCTSEKFFSTMDDYYIYECISKQYPSLLESEANEQTKRKTIIALLENENELNELLDTYNMNIQEFFAFLFRLCPSIFKGLFIKKIQKIIDKKKYATTNRKSQSTKTRRTTTI